MIHIAALDFISLHFSFDDRGLIQEKLLLGKLIETFQMQGIRNPGE
jgi:hypothetical protein